MKVNCQKFLFDAKVEAQKCLISKATDKSVTVPRELIKHIPDAVLQKVNAIYSIYIKNIHAPKRPQNITPYPCI